MSTLSLREFLRIITPAARIELANRAGTTVGYLHRIADGSDNPSEELKSRIVAASNDLVSFATPPTTPQGRDSSCNRNTSPQ